LPLIDFELTGKTGVFNVGPPSLVVLLGSHSYLTRLLGVLDHPPAQISIGSGGEIKHYLVHTNTRILTELNFYLFFIFQKQFHRIYHEKPAQCLPMPDCALKVPCSFIKEGFGSFRKDATLLNLPQKHHGCPGGFLF